jgi:hypothetical protein
MIELVRPYEDLIKNILPLEKCVTSKIAAVNGLPYSSSRELTECDIANSTISSVGFRYLPNAVSAIFDKKEFFPPHVFLVRIAPFVDESYDGKARVEKIVQSLNGFKDNKTVIFQKRYGSMNFESSELLVGCNYVNGFLNYLKGDPTLLGKAATVALKHL